MLVRTLALLLSVGLLAGCAEGVPEAGTVPAAMDQNPFPGASAEVPVPSPSPSPASSPAPSPDPLPLPSPVPVPSPVPPPSDGDAWTTFRARYVDETNGTSLTLELQGAAPIFDAKGRNVSAYALVEHAWLTGNREEERVHMLSSEGRIVRLEERSCERNKYKQGCDLKSDRVVTFLGAGGVPPLGVLWPQLIEREGELTSWAYGRETVLAAASTREGDVVTVRASVPFGQTQHGTPNATFDYAPELPVPRAIGSMGLREFAAGPALGGADALATTLFAVHAARVRGSPDWFPGANEAPSPLPMSAKEILADAARSAPAIGEAACLTSFAWQGIQSQMTWRSVPNTTVTNAYFGVVGTAGSSSYTHIRMAWPNGTATTETSPAPSTLYAPSVCEEMRSWGEADAGTWGGLAFARERFAQRGALTKLSYDALGMRATGAPREQGWASAAWTIDGVSMGWNPACECLTYVRAPTAFFG